MLHVGIILLKKNKRLFIVDYIKPSPVYQVKCKLVSPVLGITRNSIYYLSLQIYNSTNTTKKSKLSGLLVGMV